MKNKFYYFIIGTICAILISCDKPDPEPASESTSEPIPEAQIAIIHITPEMRNRVWVSPVVDSIQMDNAGKYYTLFYDTLLALSNTQVGHNAISFAEEQLGILGSNPYIMLDDNYAIIDWKWAMFHPLSGEFIIARHKTVLAGDAYSTNPGYCSITNEKYYLLESAWSDLKDLKKTWKLTEGTNIEKPQVMFINLSKIEEYGNLQMNRANLRDKYSTTEISVRKAYTLFCRDKNTASDYVKSCNELQDYYILALKEMIKNNNLLK